MLRHPVEPGDDRGPTALAVAAEHPDADQVDLACHTEGLAADGTRDVGTVAVAVLAGPSVLHRVEAEGGAAAELGVGVVDAGVDDVGVHARAVALEVELPVEWEVLLVDPVQAPARGLRPGAVFDRLARGDGDHGVLLDGLDARELAHRLHLRRGEVGGVAVQGRLVGEEGGHTGRYLAGEGARRDVLLQRDDVAAGDRVGRGRQGRHDGGAGRRRNRAADGRGTGCDTQWASRTRAADAQRANKRIRCSVREASGRDPSVCDQGGRQSDARSLLRPRSVRT